MNTQYIDLDLSKRTGNQHVTVGQGDAAGTTIVATIYDNGTPLAESGITAQFLIELPDRQHYIRDDAEYANGTVTYVCNEEYIASVAGYTDNAYFELHAGDDIISTERFSITILPCAYDGLGPGESYDTLIDEALELVGAATGRADASATSANNAATAANAAATSAGNAATSANSAAANANAAAAEARSAVAHNARYYFDKVQEGGRELLVLMDAGPDPEGD